jgi:hypothetical protein
MTSLLPTEYVVDLTKINQGAAVEMFSEELKKVLANIDDANTDPKEKREITLKFTFLPDVDRKQAQVAIDAKSKLAAHVGTLTTVYFGQVEGEQVAVEANPTQGRLFDRPETKIREIPIRREAGETK